MKKINNNNSKEITFARANYKKIKLKIYLAKLDQIAVNYYLIKISIKLDRIFLLNNNFSIFNNETGRSNGKKIPCAVGELYYYWIL